MYYVEISYSFDDDIIKSKSYHTVEFARNELLRMLSEEIGICVLESDIGISVLPPTGNPYSLTLDYLDGDYAFYEIKKI